MKPQARETPTAAPALFATILVGLGLVATFPPPAVAREMPGGSILSPRLVALARPGVRGAGAARQAAAVGLPVEGPGSLQRDGRRVVVQVRFSGGTLARLDELRAGGMQVLSASRRYQTATIAATPADLPDLNGVPGVVSAAESLAPMVASACQGSVVSAGDAQLRAALARSDFGVDGAGIKVGVLSDSFATASGTATTAAQDVLSGDLPGSGNPCGNTTPVHTLPDYSPLFPGEEETTDEGRAMAQIVHDIAPGAAIDFATAERSEEEFADHIKALAKAGANVIVDDVGYFEEPFFQDGPVAVAISEVVAKGVSYLTATGNDNLENGSGDRYASWETPEFRDSGSCPAQLELLGPKQCLDFDPASGPPDETFGIIVAAKETLIVDLQWAEPWYGVETDLDAFLLDAGGKPIVTTEGTSDNVNGEPVEVIGWKNTKSEPVEVQLAINRCFGVGCNVTASESTHPRVKFALLENGAGVVTTEYPKSSGGDEVGPTIYGHAGSPAAISVGAARASTGKLEPYSSRGPVTHYYGPVTGTTPAAPLSPAQVIHKPDVVASDCVRTTFFVPAGSEFRFCGTSAAAPHAAGVLALARQANPTMTAAALRNALLVTAAPLAPFEEDAVGHGLVDARAAVDLVALPPQVTFVEPPVATNDRTPAIAFAANRPASFTCALDGGAPLPCASPFTPAAPLTDGSHLLRVEATDLGGRTGAAELRFTVDTVAPNTSISHHPRKRIRTRKRRVLAAFRFSTDAEGGGFVCRIDGGLFRFCPSPFRRRFGPGRHVLRVKAYDAAGNVDPTPAVFRFRVRRAGVR